MYTKFVYLISVFQQHGRLEYSLYKDRSANISSFKTKTKGNSLPSNISKQ